MARFPTGNIDTIKIAGLTPSQVTLSRDIESGIVTNDLLVTIAGTSDKLRVQDQFCIALLCHRTDCF